MMQWLKNLKSNNSHISLDEYLKKISPDQIKEIQLKLLPDMIKRIDKISKNDQDFRLNTMKLINDKT